MKETKRLFYEDVYQKEFEATVLFAGQDERGYYVILDQTAFYPEGGGQPSDRGTLEKLQECKTAGQSPAPEISEQTPEQVLPQGTGQPPIQKTEQIAVLDVQSVENEIRHYLNKPVEEGQCLHGKIDWQRRFDLMQQHSGEHIISGLIHEKYGYDNVGFHMGEELITIDLNGMLEKEQISEIENLANAYIWENRKTNIFMASEKERKTLPYRSKKELGEDVRLVEFPGADLCACCGLHVESAGEIGLVKLISSRKFKEGVRIEMLSGKRAFDYLNRHFKENSQIAVQLSVKPGETSGAVRRLGEEIYGLKGELMQERQEKFEMRARECAGKGDLLLFAKHLEPAQIRKCADAILNTCDGICVLMSGDDENGYKYAVGERDGDVRELVKKMNQALLGKGGGKPFFAQGSLSGQRKDIINFFETEGFEIL